jgi:type IV secretion system T-DNA border endonuclease VirD1
MAYSEDPLLPELPLHSRRYRQGVDPNGYKIVSVRLREAEFEAFSEQVQTLGLTNNMALRIAARRIGGFLEIDDTTRHTLEEAVHAIGVISQNIRSLHASYAESGRVDMKEFDKHRAEFGHEFATLDAQLRIILNVSRRRVDGRLMLQNAM